MGSKSTSKSLYMKDQIHTAHIFLFVIDATTIYPSYAVSHRTAHTVT